MEPAAPNRTGRPHWGSRAPNGPAPTPIDKERNHRERNAHNASDQAQGIGVRCEDLRSDANDHCNGLNNEGRCEDRVSRSWACAPPRNQPKNQCARNENQAYPVESNNHHRPPRIRRRANLDYTGLDSCIGPKRLLPVPSRLDHYNGNSVTKQLIMRHSIGG